MVRKGGRDREGGEWMEGEGREGGRGGEKEGGVEGGSDGGREEGRGKRGRELQRGEKASTNTSK